jgi:hypothetical protein
MAMQQSIAATQQSIAATERSVPIFRGFLPAQRIASLQIPIVLTEGCIRLFGPTISPTRTSN